MGFTRLLTQPRGAPADTLAAAMRTVVVRELAHGAEGDLGFVVLNAGVERDHADIVGEVIGMVRNDIGPVAAFKTATVVERLPKTRSGKILRGTMRAIADCEDWNMPATIDDPVILDEIGEALRGIGYAGEG